MNATRSHVVDLGEQFDVPITQPRIRREETEVLRLRRDTIVEGDELVRIGRPDRAQMRNAAVGKQHVGFPLSWVSGRVLVNISRGLAHGHGQKPTHVTLLAGFEGIGQASRLQVVRQGIGA